jgi:hypothetical protein
MIIGSRFAVVWRPRARTNATPILADGQRLRPPGSWSETAAGGLVPDSLISSRSCGGDARSRAFSVQRACRNQVYRLEPDLDRLRPEAYRRLVALPVFKTGEAEQLGLAGSIPVRLRHRPLGGAS